MFFSFILLMAGFHCCVLGAPLTIEYNDLQMLEGSASIGRGYTFSTNSFQSTCMNMTGDVTSIQESYNYDCK